MSGVCSLARLRERVGVRVVNGEPVKNDAAHTIGFSENLPIVEAQHMEAMTGKHLCAPFVLGRHIGFEVMCTIKLNHQARFHAGKVCEERPDWVLPTEFVARHATVA